MYINLKMCYVGVREEEPSSLDIKSNKAVYLMAFQLGCATFEVTRVFGEDPCSDGQFYSLLPKILLNLVDNSYYFKKSSVAMTNSPPFRKIYVKQQKDL